MGKTLKKNPLYLLIFMIPTVAAFIVGFVYPFGMGIYLSLCKFKSPKHIDFIGLRNYEKIFSGGTQSERFLQSFWFTAFFAIVSTILINVLAFAIAVLLTKNFGGTTLFRTIFFMPNLLGGVLLGTIWKILINGVLSVYKDSLTNKGIYGFTALIIVLLWQQIGYMMIIYVAGLQGVSDDLKEAAKIDGADSRQILFKVTIPLVMPSISMCTFLTLTNGFKLFDQNIAMTAGLPNHKTEMLALNIYNTFYGTRGQMGFAQAKAVIFFLIVGLIAILQLKITQSKEAD